MGLNNMSDRRNEKKIMSYEEWATEPFTATTVYWDNLTPAPTEYYMDYGDGDAEWFYATDEHQAAVFAGALALEHYWFYDNIEISDMFRKGTISYTKRKE